MNRHRDERRKELIEAAKELVNTHGYEKLTVRALCERVGIVPSAFYYIFKDRNELILSISGGIDEFFTAEADTYLSLPAPRALCEFCLAYMRFIEGTGANCNWQIHMCRRDDPQSYERSENRAVTRLVRQIIARGQQEGSFVPDDPEILFDFIMLFLRGQSFDWSRHLGRYDLCASCRAKLPMLMRAVMAQPCEKK